MDREYRPLAAIVVAFWIIAIAVALVMTIEPSWAHFGTSGSAYTQTPAPLAASAPTESAAAQTVAVSLTEWKITGPAGTAIGPLKAGDVTFDVHNDVTTQHEFVVFKTDADPGSFPIQDGKFNEETAGESPGEAADIAPGEAKDATMRLEPGKYVYVCNLPGHYTSGMRGQLIVQ